MNNNSWESLVNIDSQEVLQQNLFNRDDQLNRMAERLLQGAHKQQAVNDVSDASSAQSISES